MKSEPRSCRAAIANAVAWPRRSATRLPVGRVRSSPCHGSQRSKTWCMIPVPRVSVRNSVRKPISPRAGARYSIRAQPVPWLTISCRRPLRSESSCVTTPMYSSGTSIATRSTGSCFLPSISRVSTSGLPTVSSKPSRRMISTSTASCSSPRPCTSQTSGLEVGRTRSETLPTSSCSSRAIEGARGHLVAFGAGERRGVDPERHRRATARRRRSPAAAAGRRGRRSSRRSSPRAGLRARRSRPARPRRRGRGRAPRSRRARSRARSRSSRRRGTTRPARPCGSCRAARAAAPGGRRRARRRGS